ncbi:MAG: hypothetical protein ACC662_08875, partial [Planctomycetota bacterium]
DGPAFDVRVRLALLETDAARPARASTILRGLRARAQEEGDPDRLSFVESALALLALQEGDRNRAARHLEALLEPGGEGEVEAKACLAALGRFDLEAAEKEYEAFSSTEDHATLLFVHLWLERAARDGRHVRIAHEMLESLVAHAPEEDRAELKERLPLYREIEEAWRAREAAEKAAGDGKDH